MSKAFHLYLLSFRWPAVSCPSSSIRLPHSLWQLYRKSGSAPEEPIQQVRLQSYLSQITSESLRKHVPYTFDSSLSLYETYRSLPLQMFLKCFLNRKTDFMKNNMYPKRYEGNEIWNEKWAIWKKSHAHGHQILKKKKNSKNCPDRLQTVQLIVVRTHGVQEVQIQFCSITRPVQQLETRQNLLLWQLQKVTLPLST